MRKREREREGEGCRRDGRKFSSMKYTYKQRGYVGLQIDFISFREGERGVGIKIAHMQNFAIFSLFCGNSTNSLSNNRMQLPQMANLTQ